MFDCDCEAVVTCTSTVITEKLLAAKDVKIKSLENQVERWRASNQEPHAEIKRLVKKLRKLSRKAWRLSSEAWRAADIEER